MGQGSKVRVPEKIGAERERGRKEKERGGVSLTGEDAALATGVAGWWRFLASTDCGVERRGAEEDRYRHSTG